MVKLQDFLSQKLTTRSSFQLSPKDQRKLKQDTVGFLIDRITSGKFKKNKADVETIANLQRKVQEAVKANQPLKFTFPFGGYKLHSMPSYPSVDWAEFFTIAYYADYLSQIVEHYAPGAEFYFVSDEVIINRLNNLPQVDVDAYTESFKKLLEIFSKHFPRNIQFKFQRVRDIYDSEQELWDELESYIPETSNNWQSFPADKKAARRTMMLLNFKFDGEKDLTKLSDTEIDKLVEDNTTLHDAYMKLTKRRGFTRGADKIVVFTRPINDSITIGTTKYSAVKFWTGFGAVRKGEDRWEDLVLSPQQLQAKEFTTEKVDLIDLPNFDKIRVYN